MLTSSVRTPALIYQSNIETSTDPSVEIILGQGSGVIHEAFVSRKSQRNNDRASFKYHAPIYSVFTGLA